MKKLTTLTLALGIILIAGMTANQQAEARSYNKNSSTYAERPMDNYNDQYNKPNYQHESRYDNHRAMQKRHDEYHNRYGSDRRGPHFDQRYQRDSDYRQGGGRYHHERGHSHNGYGRGNYGHGMRHNW